MKKTIFYVSTLALVFVAGMIFQSTKDDNKKEISNVKYSEDNTKNEDTTHNDMEFVDSYTEVTDTGNKDFDYIVSDTSVLPSEPKYTESYSELPDTDNNAEYTVKKYTSLPKK